MYTRATALLQLLKILQVYFSLDYHPRTYIKSMEADLHFLVVYAATASEHGELNVLARMMKSDDLAPLSCFKVEQACTQQLFIPLNSREEWEHVYDQYTPEQWENVRNQFRQ